MRRFGLQAQLILALCLFLVGIAAITGWLYLVALDTAAAHRSRTVRLDAAQGAHLLDFWMDERTGELRAIDALPWQSGNTLMNREHLAIVRGELAGAQALEVRDPDGHVVLRTGQPELQLPPRAWFVEAAKAGQSLLTDVGPAGDRTVLVAHPLRSRNGAVAGLLVAYFGRASFDALFERLPAEHQAFAVVDRRGRLLYEWLFGQVVVRPMFAGTHVLLPARPAVSRTVLWDHEKLLTAAHRSDGSGLVFISAISPRQDYGFVRVLQVQLWGVFGLSLALAALLGLWIHREIAGPLERMTAVARGVAGGDLAARVGVVGTGEVQDLAQAFDVMTGRLAQAVKNREVFWEHAPLAMFRIDKTRQVVDLNPAAAATLRRLAKRSPEGLVKLDDFPPLAEAFANVERTGQPWSGRLRFQDGDRQTFWECLCLPLKADGAKEAVVSLVETTGAVKRELDLEAEVSRKAADLLAALQRERLLARVAAALRAERTVDRVLATAVEVLVAELKASRVLLLRAAKAEPDVFELVHQATAPGVAPLASFRFTLKDVPELSHAAWSGSTVTIRRLPAERGGAAVQEARSTLVVPVAKRGDLLGFMAMQQCEVERTWTHEEQRLFEALAAMIATEVSNARLYEETLVRADELARAYADLQALDRAKTEFLSLISHELRTPLNVITGYAGMLEEGSLGGLEPQARAAAGHVLDSGKRLLALVNDLLDVARMEAGALGLACEAVDYGALVRDILYETQEQALERGIALENQECEGGVLVWADPYRTSQVLENLLSNAIKFSRKGDKVRVAWRREGTDVLTEVSDTGPGIPAEAMSKLFTKFYQVDMSATRSHGGTGLGLVIVKGLVEAMGGRVGALSHEGKGSTFWFTLPVAAEDGTRPLKESRP